MKKIFRRGMKASEAASIRRGIMDARSEIAFAMEFGVAPFKVLPGAPDELYNKAHYRTIIKAVEKVFRRTTTKVERAIEWLNEEKENAANQQ